MSALRMFGICLLLWAYGMNVHSVIGDWREATAPPETLAQEHLHGMAEQAGHAEGPPASEAPPSKVAIALTGVLLAAGAVIALWPLRLGVRWGVWATVVVLLGIAAPEFATNPRCWVAYDPTKHGCHTFLIALLVAATGLALCAVSLKQENSKA